MTDPGRAELGAAPTLIGLEEQRLLEEAQALRDEAAELLRRAQATPAPPTPSGVDPVELASHVRRRWWIVAICVVLGMLAALGVTATQTELYRSEVQLFVSTAAVDAPGLNQGGLFAQQRVKSYAELARSPAVTAKAIEDLDLDMSPDDLAGRIDTSAPLDTVLITVGVSDPSPARARDLADAVGRSLQEVVEDLEDPGGATEPPVTLSVVRPAALPDEPSRPRPLLNVGLGLLAGLAVGLTAAVALGLRDRWTSG